MSLPRKGSASLPSSSKIIDSLQQAFADADQQKNAASLVVQAIIALRDLTFALKEPVMGEYKSYENAINEIGTVLRSDSYAEVLDSSEDLNNIIGVLNIPGVQANDTKAMVTDAYITLIRNNMQAFNQFKLVYKAAVALERELDPEPDLNPKFISKTKEFKHLSDVLNQAGDMREEKRTITIQSFIKLSLELEEMTKKLQTASEKVQEIERIKEKYLSSQGGKEMLDKLKKDPSAVDEKFFDQFWRGRSRRVQLTINSVEYKAPGNKP